MGNVFPMTGLLNAEVIEIAQGARPAEVGDAKKKILSVILIGSAYQTKSVKMAIVLITPSVEETQTAPEISNAETDSARNNSIDADLTETVLGGKSA